MNASSLRAELDLIRRGLAEIEAHRSGGRCRARDERIRERLLDEMDARRVLLAMFEADL